MNVFTFERTLVWAAVALLVAAYVAKPIQTNFGPRVAVVADCGAFGYGVQWAVDNAARYETIYCGIKNAQDAHALKKRQPPSNIATILLKLPRDSSVEAAVARIEKEIARMSTRIPRRLTDFVYSSDTEANKMSTEVDDVDVLHSMKTFPLFSALTVSRRFLPLLRAHDAKVTVVSYSAKPSGDVVYDAAQAAMIGFANSLATKGVRTSVVVLPPLIAPR